MHILATKNHRLIPLSRFIHLIPILFYPFPCFYHSHIHTTCGPPTPHVNKHNTSYAYTGLPTYPRKQVDAHKKQDVYVARVSLHLRLFMHTDADSLHMPAGRGGLILRCLSTCSLSPPLLSLSVVLWGLALVCRFI